MPRMKKKKKKNFALFQQWKYTSEGFCQNILFFSETLQQVVFCFSCHYLVYFEMHYLFSRQIYYSFITGTSIIQDCFMRRYLPCKLTICCWLKKEEVEMSGKGEKKMEEWVGLPILFRTGHFAWWWINVIPLKIIICITVLLSRFCFQILFPYVLNFCSCCCSSDFLKKAFDQNKTEANVTFFIFSLLSLWACVGYYKGWWQLDWKCKMFNKGTCFKIFIRRPLIFPEILASQNGGKRNNKVAW